MPHQEQRYKHVEQQFAKWEKVKDMIDQCLDLMLNLRQSGHPGGSRSKVHILVTTMLSGVMRWDIRHPEKRFGDRFILVAGHTIPLIYVTLAVLNEAMRRKFQQTGDPKYRVAPVPEQAVFWEDLLTFRHNGGLPGHAEMAGKTLFLKSNTGPSGHGSPVAAGEALALKLAGAGDVRVFALEGEGGLTAGVTHETMNSAWGLGLDNLYYLVDWNDYGIDQQAISDVVYGTPNEWFGAHGWRVAGTEQGMEWPSVAGTILDLVFDENPGKQPNIAWFKTRKGREYGVYDNASHGVPHKPMNSPAFWDTKRPFIQKYGIAFEGFGEAAPATTTEQIEQTRRNLQSVFQVYDQDPALVDYLADRLVELGESVSVRKPTLYYDFTQNPSTDPVITDYQNYPADIFVPPGTKVANRAGLAKFGAWLNAYCHEKYGRPLVIAMSADLADSTNISGFAKPYGEFEGFGVYRRETNPTGCLLPQEITEFANAGISSGIATVNLAERPYEEFNGFYAACSTYGSFVYLKYGPMRLLSQLTQDSELQVGKVLWVAGHSGPETAEDSRTHFGIFSPGITQMFPEGQVINLYPWEHNEVAPMLGAALASNVPIIVLHLTRPPVEIPDRAKLGMASHLDAAKGAYLIRDYAPGQPKMGTIFVQGTSTTSNVISLLPKLDEAGLNVKLVAAVSPELFKLQPSSYRQSIVSDADWFDSTLITNASRRNMHDWIAHTFSEQYAMSADWDNRWRTGGSVEELCEEAHLSPEWLLKGIEKFAREREQRRQSLSVLLKG
ncbi:transketolase [candidate division KSB3 bacterium]|uniref:Transketolase n=1 Tax=candidate division KSB3 bacterium TaxID=2044937 RepID=A0A9D5Q4X3_9BACT|nr:transketolase [candidate division KSB3 bacterium]MBD3324179.1 transketolase [candidate division KSB3 bacterium]